MNKKIMILSESLLLGLINMVKMHFHEKYLKIIEENYDV